MTRNRKLAAGTAMATVLAGAAAAQDELNALVWCDHTDPALLEPFEEAHGVKVNVKEYEGTGTALALIEQSQPGDWDVLTEKLPVSIVKRVHVHFPAINKSVFSAEREDRPTSRRQPAWRYVMEVCATK